jgi:hypothetical protein
VPASTTTFLGRNSGRRVDFHALRVRSGIENLHD